MRYQDRLLMILSWRSFTEITLDLFRPCYTCTAWTRLDKIRNADFGGVCRLLMSDDISHTGDIGLKAPLNEMTLNLFRLRHSLRGVIMYTVHHRLRVRIIF